MSTVLPVPLALAAAPAAPAAVVDESAVPVPPPVAAHPAWVRLESQLAWFDGRSTRCQRRYKRLKLAQVTLAVAIPAMSLLPDAVAKATSALAGATIALLEAVQQMNQDATLWVTYRATSERLKQEKFLFLAVAGHYRGFSESERLLTLAERVEDILCSQNTKWTHEGLQALAGGPTLRG